MRIVIKKLYREQEAKVKAMVREYMHVHHFQDIKSK
jgi:hypothetical protein